MDTTPDFINSQSTNIQIIVWLGGLIVIGLCTALAVIWKENIKQAEYIKEQDKANLIVLNDLINFSKNLTTDVQQVEKSINDNVILNITEIKLTLKNIENLLK
jgi:hypothetical protein